MLPASENMPISSPLEKIGMFSEAGSIYARDILKVKNGDIWESVTNAPE